LAVDHPWCAAGAVPIVLSVGSLTPLKDFPTLIRAFSIVKSTHDCRLVILGEGPDREKLESLIDDLDLRRDVLLPGFADNPFAWMRHARVFVSSSLTEGCPNALMEALACGTPVVSTDCIGGSSEVLEGGKWGRLVPIGRPDAMAAAILATLESVAHPDVRQRASDFGLAGVARDYLRVLLPAAAAAER
jgi:glycosyltransferase involved in cell wall biosynthesis